MRGGHNKVPTPIAQARGNPGKRPLNDAEPVPEGALPANPPDWLAPMAKRHYRKLAAILHWLTDADADRLSLYCQAYARYRQYTSLMGSLDLDHEVFKDWEVKDVVQVLNSLPIRLRDAEQSMISHGSALGMDPVNRTRINAKPQQAADTFDNWERARAEA